MKPPFTNETAEAEAIEQLVAKYRDELDWLLAKNGDAKRRDIQRMNELSRLSSDAQTAALALRLAAAKPRTSY